VSDALKVLEYLDATGQSPFARWFAGLNPAAAAKVTIALYRLGAGNFSNVKGVSAGVFEYKIDFGLGYRIYFGKDGDRVIILLGGSDKKGQATAITKAQDVWAAYKKRKLKAK
jgi:putative addiction module killer protein